MAMAVDEMAVCVRLQRGLAVVERASRSSSNYGIWSGGGYIVFAVPFDVWFAG